MNKEVQGKNKTVASHDSVAEQSWRIRTSRHQEPSKGWEFKAMGHQHKDGQSDQSRETNGVEQRVWKQAHMDLITQFMTKMTIQWGGERSFIPVVRGQLNIHTEENKYWLLPFTIHNKSTLDG